jgi:shikimate 5-dehydrogenase
MADEEKLGYHKGAIESLLNERSELARLLQIVNSLIEKHSKALESMGVDVEKFVEKLQQRKKDKMEEAKKKYDLSKEELPD